MHLRQVKDAHSFCLSFSASQLWENGRDQEWNFHILLVLIIQPYNDWVYRWIDAAYVLDKIRF